MTRSRAKRRLKSLRDYAAAAKRRGWPDVIRARDYREEFAELDVLADANVRAGAATQANVAKLREFKRLIAASLGTTKHRRLALAGLQALIWYWRDSDHDWRRLTALQHAANAMLQRTAREMDELYAITLLRLVDAAPRNVVGALDEEDEDDDLGSCLIDLYPRIITCVAPVVARGGRPDDEVAKVLRGMREAMTVTNYNKRLMRDGAAVIERLLA